MDKSPTTLLEAVSYFADPERAHDHFVRVRWPHGIACPRMGCGNAEVLKLTSKARPRFRCKECKRDFTAKVGTIFEDSPIPLTKWMPAIWMLANCKNGISSCELARALGITQKTAWFMLHRIRVAMDIAPDKPLTGIVEADETFIGGKQRNKHGNTKRTVTGHKKLMHGPATGKTTVLGMVERGNPSQVRAMVIPDHSKRSIVPHLYANILPGSLLYTDALRTYRNLPAFQHEFVDHMIEYVKGNVHTNTIENFWNCLKRTLNGTYIAPRPFHLNAYVAEQVFRFNERDGKDADRFAKTAKSADGKRLTYRKLTRKD